MFLSKLFKHARTKALVVLAGLSMTLGVGATISTVAAAQQNEAVETKAATNEWALVGSDFNNFGARKTLASITLKSTSYYYVTVTMTQNATFRFRKGTTNWDTTLGFSNFMNGNESKTGFSTDWFENANNDNNFKVKVAGSYTFLFANTFDSYDDKAYGIYCFRGSPNQTYYLNTNGHWSGTPKCYGWSDVTTSDCLVKDGTTWAAWKGDTMSAVAGKTNVFSITYPIPPHNIIFNDGNNKQTSDLTPTAGQYFSLESGTDGNWNTKIKWAVKPYAKLYKGSSLTSTIDLAWEYVLDGSTHTPTSWTTYYDSGTTYTFVGRYSNEECTTPYTPGSITGPVTYYVKFTDQNTYSVTYTKVLNTTVATWWGTATTSSYACGTPYSSIEPEEVYGFTFAGWYSDSSCRTGIGSTELTGNDTGRYAKYMSDPDANRVVYIALPSGDCYNNVTYGGSLFVWFTNGEDTSKDVPVQRVEGVTSTNLYMASIPSDATGFSFHAGLSVGEMQAGKRTYWTSLSEAGAHNLYVCNSVADTAQGGESRYGGTWKDVYFQFQTASNSGFSSDVVTTDMSDPADLTSGNDAEALGITAPASYYFRIAVIVNGTQNNLTAVGTDDNTKACTSSSGSNRFKASSLTVNAYLKDNVIYLLDTSSIEGGGYLYISTTLPLTSINITVSFQDTSSVTVYPFSADKMSAVSGVGRTATLTYNSTNGLIKLPIFNLRGGETPKAGQSYSVTFANGANTKSISLPQSTTTPLYYLSLFDGSLSTADSNEARAADLAYSIDAAVSGAKFGSVCAIQAGTASSLAEEYNTLAKNNSAIQSLLEGAEIETYKPEGNSYSDSTGPEITTKTGVGLADIYVRLCIIGGVTPTYAPAGAAFIPGAPTNDQSPLTLTLWIVLGCGLLGLGAIGTAYFVSKKKKHQA